MARRESDGRGFINVKPGERCFLVGNALCDCFSIGIEGETEFFLRGDIVGALFAFNGMLFIPGAYASGVPLIDFPRRPLASGWQVQARADTEGFDLVSRRSGESIFGYRIDDNVCRITTDLYNETGERVASAGDGEFNVLRGPARLGKSGILIA